MWGSSQQHLCSPRRRAASLAVHSCRSWCSSARVRLDFYKVRGVRAKKTKMSVDIKLNRVDRVYRPQEQVSGVVLVNSQSPMSFNSITLVVEGTVTLQLSARSVGLFEAFYSSLQPVQLMRCVGHFLFFIIML